MLCGFLELWTNLCTHNTSTLWNVNSYLNSELFCEVRTMCTDKYKRCTQVQTGTKKCLFFSPGSWQILIIPGSWKTLDLGKSWEILGNPGSGKILENPGSWKILENPGSWKILETPVTWKILGNPGSGKILETPGSWKILENPGHWKNLEYPVSSKILENPGFGKILETLYLRKSWKPLDLGKSWPNYWYWYIKTAAGWTIGHWTQSYW